MAKNKFLRKFTEWEYWPWYMFYLPNLPYGLYLTIRARSLTFYTATNPGIKSSGNGTESKFKTLSLIPDEFKPKSIFVPEQRDFEQVIHQLNITGIHYPVIAKPDVGFRGNFVKKIYSDQSLKDYLLRHPIPIIIQDFVDLPYECGVFFEKMPTATSGKVTSLTLKSYMSVTGDGSSTVAWLAAHNKRAKHYLKNLAIINEKIWQTIPQDGEKIILSEIGNHARGTEFINGKEFINSDLDRTFNELSNKIPGFFYGRFDIKYQTLEELKVGKNFKFLEVNGIISEPTHIYDARKGTYFEALATFRRQWKSMYLISTANHSLGIPYMKPSVFLKEVKWLLNYISHLKKISESNKT